MADYLPEPGALPPGIDIAHGTIKAEHRGKLNSVRGAIDKRLNLHDALSPSCHQYELLLTLSAADTLLDLNALIALYERQLIPGQYDLLNITTVRFGHSVPAHRAYEWARGWARSSFVLERNVPVLLVQHLPGLAGRANKPHVHLIHWCRTLDCARFGSFTALTKPGAKAMLAAEWKTWIGTNA